MRESDIQLLILGRKACIYTLLVVFREIWYQIYRDYRPGQLAYLYGLEAAVKRAENVACVAMPRVLTMILERTLIGALARLTTSQKQW